MLDPKLRRILLSLALGLAGVSLIALFPRDPARLWPRQLAHLCVHPRILWLARDVNLDGRDEMIHVARPDMGFILATIDSLESNSLYPYEAQWHCPARGATHCPGLSAIDLDGDDSLEIVQVLAYEDGTLRLKVGWWNTRESSECVLATDLPGDSLEVAGWSCHRDLQTGMPCVVVALAGPSGSGVLLGSSLALDRAMANFSCDLRWMRRIPRLKGFLGHLSCGDSLWDPMCLVTYGAGDQRAGCDSLICLDGLTGSEYWRLRLGFGGTGALAWHEAPRGRLLLAATGRSSRDLGDYRLLAITPDGIVSSQCESHAHRYGTSLTSRDVDGDGESEIIVGDDAGTVTLLSTTLQKQIASSPRLAEGSVRCVYLGDPLAPLLAYDDHGFFPLSADLESLSEAFSCDAGWLTDKLCVFAHPSQGPVVLSIVWRPNQEAEHAFVIDPIVDPASELEAFPNRRVLPWLAAGGAGVLIGILGLAPHPSRTRPEGRWSVHCRTAQADLHLALRDFRHNQPTWRVYRGVSRLCQTLAQRGLHGQEEVIALLEQRLATVHHSSAQALMRVVATARTASWSPRDIDALVIKHENLERLLALSQANEDFAQGILARAAELAAAAEAVADKLELLVAKARAERQSDVLLVVALLIADLRRNSPRRKLSLYIDGDAIYSAYVPQAVLQQALASIVASLFAVQRPGKRLVTCHVRFSSGEIKLRLEARRETARSRRRRGAAFVDAISDLNERLSLFGTELEGEITDEHHAVNVRLEVANA